jgi:hypothetical protein
MSRARGRDTQSGLRRGHPPDGNVPKHKETQIVCKVSEKEKRRRISHTTGAKKEARAAEHPERSLADDKSKREGPLCSPVTVLAHEQMRSREAASPLGSFCKQLSTLLPLSMQPFHILDFYFTEEVEHPIPLFV